MNTSHIVDTSNIVDSSNIVNTSRTYYLGNRLDVSNICGQHQLRGARGDVEDHVRSLRSHQGDQHELGPNLTEAQGNCRIFIRIRSFFMDCLFLGTLRWEFT